MALASVHVAIDLTPLLKGGANGGIKQYIFEAIPWLRRRFGEKIRFLFLTSSISHVDVRTQLGSSLDSIICINRNSKQHALEFHGHGDRDFFWHDPPADFLSTLGVNILYCPFGATFLHCPGVPTLSTVVDLLHLDYPESLTGEECLHREHYFKEMASMADAFQCISDYGAKRLSESYNIDPDHIFRTHLIIADRLKRLRGEKKAFNTPFFFYPANFWPHKNHLTLLVAYANYLSRTKENAWKLVLTGFDSPEARSVLETIETLGISDHVRYEGHVGDARLHEIWSDASALVFPSLHEGFGIPLVEAMAYQLPIICGETTCLREVAGDAAVFVDASNPFKIADALVMITGDHAMRARLSKNANLRFNSFSFDQEMEKLVHKMEELANRGPRQATVKGINKDGTVAKEVIFSNLDHGHATINAIFYNNGMNARGRLRCGDRRFGSWELPGGQETIIKANIFCDAAPCVIEIEIEGKREETEPHIICKTLLISRADGSDKNELFVL